MTWFPTPPQPNVLPAIFSIALFPVGIYTLHLFAMKNGTFERFFKLLDNGKLPSGRPFQAWNTGGRFPKVDWQIRAFGIFMSSFSENLSQPGTSLDGFLFAGSWGPAWFLLVMESFRVVNQGHWLSYLAIPGYLIFHHAHGLFTPLYICLALLFLPSLRPENQTPEALFIPHKHLVAMPISFTLGFVLPVFLLCLPSPRIFSHRVKDTMTGLYQQWHLIIEAIHYLLVGLMSIGPYSNTFDISYSRQLAGGNIELLRSVYSFVMVLAAIPYCVTASISIASILAISLFNPKIVVDLHPKYVLVPTWPRKGLKAKTIHDGFRWLIQWDYLLGTVAMLIMAVTLRNTSAGMYSLVIQSWYAQALKIGLYFMMGGPMGLAVGLMQEREEIVQTGLI